MSSALIIIFVVIKSENAKHLHVPMYKNLNVNAILDYGSMVEQVSQYMPDERDIPKLPRQWIINVIYSLAGDDFREWVSQ